MMLHRHFEKMKHSEKPEKPKDDMKVAEGADIVVAEPEKPKRGRKKAAE